MQAGTPINSHSSQGHHAGDKLHLAQQSCIGAQTEREKDWTFVGEHRIQVTRMTSNSGYQWLYHIEPLRNFASLFFYFAVANSSRGKSNFHFTL